MKFRAWLAFIMICSPVLSFAAENPFQLQSGNFRHATVLLAAAAGQVSAAQAANMVKQRYGGKILSVSPTQSGGKPVYRVKVLTPSGVMKIVLVDRTTGRVYE